MTSNCDVSQYGPPPFTVYTVFLPCWTKPVHHTAYIQYHHTYHVTVSYFQGFVKIVGKSDKWNFILKGEESEKEENESE